MIRQVERFATEVQTESLVKHEIAAEPEIRVHQSRCAQNIAARISEAWTNGRDERRRVEPVCRIALIRWQRPFAHTVGARGGVCSGWVGAAGDRERLGWFCREDPRHIAV